MTVRTVRPSEDVPESRELRGMTSNPSISLSPAPTNTNANTNTNTLSPPGRSTRPNSQVISPIALSTARLQGNRSPNSIPSSPTSVHSSSSAIFERDIEQLSSPHLATRDPHHIARAMTHELDAAVPSVLSSAINALNLGEDGISVIAPAHAQGSKFHSRSPSPTTSPRPPFTERQSTGPHLPGFFPPPPASSFPSPPASDINNPPSTLSPSSPQSPTTPPLSLPHATARPRPRKSNPQLSTDTAQNRLSFMSYHDLLASTPLSSVPLSAITSGQDAPGHLPGVVGLHGHGSNASVHGGGLGANEGEGGDVGGEFDREGLGRGLEERLEAVLAQERA